MKLKDVLSLVYLAAIIFGIWQFVSNYTSAVNVLSTCLLIGVIVTFIAFIYRLIFSCSHEKRMIKDIEEKENRTLSKKEKQEIVHSHYFIKDLSSLFPFVAAIFFVRAFFYEPFQIPSGSMQPTLEIGDFIVVDKNHYRVVNPVNQNTIWERNKVQRGDIVVFKSSFIEALHGSGSKAKLLAEREDWIKRVIGLPGDKVIYNTAKQSITVYKHDCIDEKQCSPIVIEYGNFGITGYYNFGAFQKERTETLSRDDNSKVEHQTLQHPEAIYGRESLMYVQFGQAPLTWVVPEGEYFVMGDNRDNSEDSRYVGFIPYKNIVGKAKYIWFSLDYGTDGSSFRGFRWDRLVTSIK